MSELSDPNADDASPRRVTDTHRPISARRRFLRRFLQQPSAVIALGFLVLLALVAVFAPVVAPKDPNAQDIPNALADPLAGEGLLGTDQLGRDLLSRVVFATRVALIAASQAVVVALFLGVPPGLVAGYLGGWTDTIIMRINDSVMSFPGIILAIAIVGILGPGLTNAMVAVGIIFAPTFLRLVRSSVLSIREETYIDASRSIGTPTTWILRRHVLINAFGPLVVQTSIVLGLAILAEASLSFLGLGVQPPNASWGSMMSEGFRQMQRQPWLIFWPGAAITLTALAFNVVGDGLRDSIGREVRRAD